MRCRYLFISLLLTGQAAAAAPDAIIQPLMARYQIPGMAVATLDRGNTHFYSYGVTSKESGKPVTPQTLFEIGSLSKTFTGTLAGYAVQQNRMSWSDGVTRWLPALKESAFDRVSLLNLATHTSGLPLFVPDEVTNDTQLMAWFRAWQPATEPGTQRVYSNGGIGMLGMIAAASLNMSFTRAMESMMLPAMGMHHTWLQVPAWAMSDYAQGYDKQDRPVRVTPGALDKEAYGLKSTAEDLLRWLAIQMREVNIVPAWRQAVAATQQGYYRTDAFTQAVMWEYYPLPVTQQQLVDGNSSSRIVKGMPATLISPPASAPLRAWYNKTGSTNGFSTYAVFIPARKVALIMLANKWIPNNERVIAAEAIIRQLENKEQK